MSSIRRKVNIIGHQNPDTDSICSALAYAWFKNRQGGAVYEARLAGQVSRILQVKHPPKSYAPLLYAFGVLFIKALRFAAGLSGNVAAVRAWPGPSGPKRTKRTAVKKEWTQAYGYAIIPLTAVFGDR